MSIEAMKLALAALAAGTDRDLIGNARIALRTAIQQAELQSAIGQAEQALSLCGIWQAMSTTAERN